MSRRMVVGWILAAVAAGGCRGGRGDASASDAARVQVASIELGREVGPDKRVAAPSASFAAGDTVYASVVTRGKAPLATLTARWRRQGELLNESTQMIAPQGETASEFHVWKPQGWPPGEGYEVEILLDGETAGRRPFSVH